MRKRYLFTFLDEIYSYRKRHVFKVIEGGKNNLIATAF